MTPAELAQLEQFWQNDATLSDLTRLLELNRLDNAEREKEIVRMLKLMAENQYTPSNMPFTSPSEIAEKLLMLNGGNPDAISILDDDEAYELNMAMLSIAMGEDQASALYSAPTAHGLLAHWYNPESTGFSPQMQRALSDYLTNERKAALLQKLENKTLTSPFSDEEAESFISEKKIELAAVPTSESAAVLSDEDPAIELGRLKAKTEEDRLKYQLVQDLRIQAQMQMNKIMQKNPDWVERTVVDKLSDTINYGIKNLTNPNSLKYPSESIFSKSLAVMDTNGRVEDTLLHFKNNFSGPVVEFTRHNLTEDVYDFAAQKCRVDGIKFPHVGCTFRDPKVAISFMQMTVASLVKAGYDIEHISVDRHLQTAFDNFKLEQYAQKMTITEAPGIEAEEPKNNDGPEPLREEMAQNLNQQINEPIQGIKADLERPDSSGGVSDLSFNQINEAIKRAELLNGDPLTWNDMQTNTGLSPTSRETVEKVKAYIGKLIDKADETHPDYIGKSFGKNQAALLRDLGLHVLIPIYGKERCQRAFKTVKDTLTAQLDNELAQSNAAAPETTNTPASDLDGVPEHITNAPGPMDFMPSEQNEIRPEDLMRPDDPGWAVDELDMLNQQAQSNQDDIAGFHEQYSAQQSEQQALAETTGAGYETPSDESSDLQSDVTEPASQGLLATQNIARYNCGGVNLIEPLKEQWVALANTPITELNQEQLLALAAMNHQEWGILNQTPWLSRREAKIIERASQDVHNALAPVQPENEALTPLQETLIKALPEHLIPNCLKSKNPGIDVSQSQDDHDPGYSRPKR